MTKQAPDDVFALYSHFDLDEQSYRVFSRQPVESTPVVPISKPVQASKPAPEIRSAPEPVACPVPISSVPISSVPISPVSVKKTIPDEGRLALHNLWRHVGSSREMRNGRTAQQLAEASVAVHPAAGGTGTTTVAAILTRLLAKSGRSCAIFDETEDPTLPIFFGAQRIADDHRRFSGLRSLFEPRIRILNRQMFAGLAVPAAEGESFIERYFSALPDHLDHLIFDAPAKAAQPSGARLQMYVAIPDLRCLAAMQKVHRDLEESGSSDSAVCVLNRFDAASALHRELLGWYRETFGNLLVIHESPLVGEALAEGTTVLDWAPDATVSTDFLSLFAAIDRQVGSSAPERLPLCS